MMLTHRNLPVAELEERHVNDMLDLMRHHYDNLDPQRFRHDLNEKEGVLLLEEQGRVAGFSTWKRLRRLHRGHEVEALFSGDTIIRPDCWGQSALFRAFAGLLLEVSSAERPLYWLLLSKGVRTYLLLPLFYRRFIPAWNQEPDLSQLELMRDLATDLYGKQFDEAAGVVRPDPPADRLSAELAEVPTHVLDSPHTRCFLERNPGYRDGHELVCMTSLALDNITRAGRRMLEG